MTNETDAVYNFKLKLEMVPVDIPKNLMTISNSCDVMAFCKEYLHMDTLSVEKSYILPMTPEGRINCYSLISSGSPSKTFGNISEIFRLLLMSGCMRFIIVHNHPMSTVVEPSTEDDIIVKSVIRSALTLQCELLDSIIIGSTACYSYVTSGRLKDLKESMGLSKRHYDPDASYKLEPVKTIKSIVKSRLISLSDMSKTLGIPLSALKSYYEMKTEPKASVALRIADYLKTDASEIIWKK